MARCEADGEDIQKWLVSNGWALAFTQFSRDYEADEKAAREAKAGMWQGAFIAPWDWRVRNKKTAILGAVKPPENAKAILLASASGPVAPSPDCTIKGNVNRSGECIYHQPTSRWYAKIEMKISKGTRWFCSVDEAEAAGCRETRRYFFIFASPDACGESATNASTSRSAACMRSIQMQHFQWHARLGRPNRDRETAE